jgi:myo-inositol-1(or 4)-monophosphatase
MIDLARAEEIGIAAIRKAGEILRSRFGTDLRVHVKSSPRDLVTEVDAQAQQIIVETIRKEFPDHRFIAEEQGADDLGTKDCPYTWIIDPLDGTTNFVHRKIDFGPMLALQKDQSFLLSVLHLPCENTLYTAISKRGAYKNGHKLSVRRTKSMIDAILSTNTQRKLSEETEELCFRSPYCASVHNYGTALKEMAVVAEGQNDGVFFKGVGIWDIAAGCLLIEEAGGNYRYELLENNNPRGGVKCVASTKEIFEELCAFVF